MRTDKDCLVHQQPYDEVFREAHDEHLCFFPLTNRCNATYDLVPLWVDPALVVIGVLLATSVIGLASTWRRHLRASSTAAP